MPCKPSSTTVRVSTEQSRRHRRCRAFSLIEVVVAVGLFTFAIVAVLGLLGPTNRQVSSTLDAQVAARLAENVNAQLTAAGYVAVRAFICGDPPTAGINNSFWLVGTRDGARVLRTGQEEGGMPNRAAENPLNAAPPAVPGLAQRERYFLVEVSRLTTTATDPLFHTADSGALALRVVVTWPYYVPVTGATNLAAAWNAGVNAGQLAPASERQSFVYTFALRP
jgi:type II secretory pathway pseudopilin PulG